MARRSQELLDHGGLVRRDQQAGLQPDGFGHTGQAGRQQRLIVCREARVYRNPGGIGTEGD
jgi:hypothetical protein